jgi:hypothetical protein
MIAKLTLQRIEDDRAVLVYEGGEEISLPRSMLPADKKEGSVFLVAIMAEGAESKDDKKELAKAILTEITQNEDTSEH